MTPSLRFLLSVLCLVCSVPAVSAEPTLMILNNNPFSRPEIVNAPPPPAVRDAVVPAEEVELELTATMVSESVPMVVVDGELLTIGEKIEGMKLIAVREGEAIFTRAGKRFSFKIDGEEPE